MSEQQLTPDQQMILRTLAVQRELAPIVDELIAVARPCAAIHLGAQEDYSRVGNSRIGGDPDLPRDWSWPRTTDQALHLVFLAQFNLAEIPTNLDGLPSQGMLYVFLEEDQDDLTHQILLWSGDETELARRAAPELDEMVEFYVQVSEAHQDDRYQPFQLTLSPSVSLPFTSTMIGSLDLPDPHAAYDNLRNDLVIQLFGASVLPTERGRSMGHLLGMPEYYYDDPRSGAYFAGQGVSDSVTHEAPHEIEGRIRAAEQAEEYPGQLDYLRKLREDLLWYQAHMDEHPAGIAAWRLLLQLESSHEVGISWNDHGTLYFLVRADDLAARDFSQTFASLFSG